MKEQLCRAFCDEISVTKVPAGLAVSTAFRREDGDKVGFYVVEDSDGVHLEDDGSTITMLEASGVDFDTETRKRALDQLLGSAGAYFDSEDMTIKTGPFSEQDTASRALNFVGALLRMEDFLLLTQEKVSSTFREDAAEAIKRAVGAKAGIRENEALSDDLNEVRVDLIIESTDRPPVCVFFGNSASRIHDAIFLHQTATYEVKTEVSVVALLEQDNSVPSDLRRRATNRLSTVPVFRRDEQAAVARIAREALGA